MDGKRAYSNNGEENRRKSVRRGNEAVPIPKPWESDWETIPIDEITAENITQATPRYSQHRQASDMFLLCTEVSAARKLNNAPRYKQWRDMRFPTTQALHELTDFLTDSRGAQGASQQPSGNNEARHLVLLYRKLAVKAGQQGRRGLCLAAHEKVLDYLMRTHLLSASTNAGRVQDYFPQHEQWWLEAFNVIMERRSSSTPALHTSNTALTNQALPAPGSIATLTNSILPTSQRPIPGNESGRDEVESAVASMISTTIPDRVPKWDDLVDVNGTKKLLEDYIYLPIKEPSAFRPGATGTGVLLFGPPGCGKTILMQSLARHCGCSFMDVPACSLFLESLGQSEKVVKRLFQEAINRWPCIIFMDHIDAIIGDHITGFNLMKNELRKHWSSLAGTGAFVVGTTSLPHTIDANFLRRLSKRIHIPLPNAAARSALIESTLSLNCVRHTLTQEQIQELGSDKHTKGFTCDEIVADGVLDPIIELVTQSLESGFFVKAGCLDGDTGFIERCREGTPGCFAAVGLELDRSTRRPRMLNFGMLEKHFGGMHRKTSTKQLEHFETFQKTYVGASVAEAGIGEREEDEVWFS